MPCGILALSQEMNKSLASLERHLQVPFIHHLWGLNGISFCCPVAGEEVFSACVMLMCGSTIFLLTSQFDLVEDFLDSSFSLPQAIHNGASILVHWPSLV